MGFIGFKGFAGPLWKGFSFKGVPFMSYEKYPIGFRVVVFIALNLQGPFKGSKRPWLRRFIRTTKKTRPRRAPLKGSMRP